ncbi:MAG TPA: hypothetical protein VGG02_01890 [Chthoniobacterales bacterium]|jgi:hypothetical protein
MSRPPVILSAAKDLTIPGVDDLRGILRYAQDDNLWVSVNNVRVSDNKRLRAC